MTTLTVVSLTRAQLTKRIIAVHGRTGKTQTGSDTAKAFRYPVLSSGNVISVGNGDYCLKHTGPE